MNVIAKKLLAIFDLESSSRVMLYSVLVGIVSGLGAALFFFLLDALREFAMGQLMGFYPPTPAGEHAAHEPQSYICFWAVLLVPTIGGLLCGMLVYGLAPEAEGHGTDAMVGSFHRLKGVIRARVPFVKGLASVLTIGTGGSAGREGPIAQIGAGFGSFLADKLRLNDWERRQLMLAGAAGGIGAIFRAPLGGALFPIEVLYATTAIELSALVPCVISSVISYSVFAAIYGQGKIFATPGELSFHGGAELPFYVGLAVVCALVGFLYVFFFYESRDRVFRRIPIPNFLKPALGGLLLGGLILLLPQVAAGGYGWIQQAIDGDASMTLWLMAVLVFAKIAATSVTISSGGSGGVFAPSLFIGAMLGGAYGKVCAALTPEGIPLPPLAAFILVGMGGFFAGVARVPLTALIMVSEMSGSYQLLVPLMVVSFLNFAILSSRWTLYEEQVPSLVDSPAHLGDFVIDVLEQIKVREVFHLGRHITSVRENMTLPQVLRLVANSKESYFPVVDDDGLMTGIFSLHDIRSVLIGNGAGSLILAADIATSPVLTVTPDDNLHTALRRYAEKNIDEIPVVDPDNERLVICMLKRKEVIAAYDRKLAALRDSA